MPVRVFGDGRPIGALHGFTLTGAQFEPLASDVLRIYTIDLPGHGRSSAATVDHASTVELVARWLSSFDSPVLLLGYSQGGRIALQTALAHPDLVERLILVSTSPGIAGASDRAARREQDAATADRIESIGLERFLDEWLAGPVTATTRLDRRIREADRAVRTENTAEGLAAALRGLGQGAQPYVGDRVGELRMPLLTISGSADAKYSRLSSKMANEAVDGRHVEISGAGHNVILEKPDQVHRAISAFLEEPTPNTNNPANPGLVGPHSGPASP